MAEKKQYSLIVFSDSHGAWKNIQKMLPVINTCDYFIFLGDGNRDIDKVEDDITAKIIRVRGNCDLMPDIPNETMLTLGNTKFLIAHGNAYGVKTSRLSYAARARELGCEWALYGHTHVSIITDAGGVMLCNPGTSSGSAPTCALIKGDGDTFFGEIANITEESDL